MNKPRLLFSVLAVLLSLAMIGCSSYTYDNAKIRIDPIPSIPVQEPVPTRMSDIKAIQDAEQARIDAEIAAREAQAAAQAEAEAKRIEAEQAEEAQRKQAEEEAEAQCQRTEADAEAKRLAEEAEMRRREAEAEAEAQRLAEEAELQRQKTEAEALQKQADAEAEAKRLAEEAELQRIADEAAAAENAKRKAEEEIARLAAEEAAKLSAPVPDADKVTLPYRYQPLQENRQLSGPVLKFSSLLIPLPDNRLSAEDAERLSQEIVSSISDIDLPVLFITGHLQNVITLVNQLRRDAVVVSNGAIVTSLPITEIGKNSVTVMPQDGKPIQLLLAYTPEYQVAEAFFNNPSSTDWQTVVKEQKESRSRQLEDMLLETSTATPVLVGASLFEPSHLDWTSFTPVVYRKAYDWPLSLLMEEKQFLDAYRTTHYSEETAAGTTIRWQQGSLDLQERIDYMYSRKLLPLETTMLSLGGLSSQSDKQAPNRYALLGTYIIP